MYTDPVADMLTRIRNAGAVKHDNVSMPFSRLKEEIAKLLKLEGYILDYFVQKEENEQFKKLTIELKYDPDTGIPVISGISKVSKPGLRVYSKSKKIKKVFGGLGVSIISTSKGLLSDRKARKENLGGEIICNVW